MDSRRDGRIVGGHGASLESVELLEDAGEIGFAFANGFGRSAFEGLFRGDAVDPALLGEFFVTGKIETDEELYGTTVFGRGVSGSGIGF